MHLSEACEEVWDDDGVMQNYPQGISAVEVLVEINKKHPGGFPYATWLDVHDEMSKLYGEPARDG